MTARFTPVGGSLERAVVEYTNRERGTAGRPPLRWDDDLAEVALGHSLDMARRDFFAHVDPDGRGLRDRVGEHVYGYWLLGENLALGHRSPAAAVAAWMRSPGHRANLLDAGFDRIGVAAVRAPSGPLWVQVFGRAR